MIWLDVSLLFEDFARRLFCVFHAKLWQHEHKLKECKNNHWLSWFVLLSFLYHICVQANHIKTLHASVHHKYYVTSLPMTTKSLTHTFDHHWHINDDIIYCLLSKPTCPGIDLEGWYKIEDVFLPQIKGGYDNSKTWKKM